MIEAVPPTGKVIIGVVCPKSTLAIVDLFFITKNNRFKNTSYSIVQSW
jgi:hypothetical protein